jgi:hypothetical protein
VVVDEHTWRPASAEALRLECAHLVAHASRLVSDAPTVLYRGQSDSSWKLNSTFARWVERRFDCSTHESYFELARIFLKHFGEAYGPSKDLMDAAAQNEGVDPWFELMKRIQQHNEDGEFKGVDEMGTNLMDWSTNVDVGLCFACSSPDIEGTLYLLDAQSAGRILVHRPYRETLDRWATTVAAKEMHGNPLLFCPRRQIADDRATRQGARYLAQFDLSVPLDAIWLAREARREQPDQIWHRLLLAPSVKEEISKELGARGITSDALMK